ncbi:hypothetical protein [Halostella salina]|uniref:hypothetical protein n=1 Tax=Halostella salina TaxID=1547897 RepID=UPI000EF77A12|nr:hypothetical protein [Halostella salina]
MDQSQRTRIARGGLSLVVAGVLIAVVAALGLSASTEVLAALVVGGVGLAVAGYAGDRPALAAVWPAPLFAAAGLYLFAADGRTALFVEALLFVVVGVAQLIFSQVWD